MGAFMELVVATGGNRSQTQRAQKPPNQTETLAARGLFAVIEDVFERDA
jgi:hypothetical protein